MNPDQNERETNSNKNKHSENDCLGNVPLNEKGIGAETSDGIPPKDEKTNASNFDSSFGEKNTGEVNDNSSSLVETRPERVENSLRTSNEHEGDEIAGSTASPSDDNDTVHESQATSNVFFNATATSEDETFPTTISVLDDNAITSEEKNRPSNTDDARDSQLVPDVFTEKKTLSDDSEVNNTGDQVVEDSNDERAGSKEDEDSVLIARQLSEGVLTDSMVDQEKKLHQEHEEEQNEIVNKVTFRVYFVKCIWMYLCDSTYHFSLSAIHTRFKYVNECNSENDVIELVVLASCPHESLLCA